MGGGAGRGLTTEVMYPCTGKVTSYNSYAPYERSPHTNPRMNKRIVDMKKRKVLWRGHLVPREGALGLEDLAALAREVGHARLGCGRTAASETEAPNVFVNLV